jgi:4-azaleucine resistance transporter AzlC
MATKSNILAGIKKGSTIALGYIPIAITFGILAKTNGISEKIAILMSVMVFAGASQFVAINLLKLGTGLWEIVITTFIVNLRHFLMSASVAEKIKNKVPPKWIPLLSFGITDETFSFISLTDKENLSTGYILGINTIAYSAWVGGTAVGVYLGKGLPTIIQNSMGIALYAMFIGLLIPSIKRSKEIAIVSLLAIIVSSSLHWGPSVLAQIPQGWKIIIITIIASALGAYLFPEEEGDLIG